MNNTSILVLAADFEDFKSFIREQKDQENYIFSSNIDKLDGSGIKSIITTEKFKLLEGAFDVEKKAREKIGII